MSNDHDGSRIVLSEDAHTKFPLGMKKELGFYAAHAKIFKYLIANTKVTLPNGKNSDSSKLSDEKNLSDIDNDNSQAQVSKSDQVLLNLNLKQKAQDASNRWMEQNRSLVLRQTPIWAKTLTILMLSLGSIAALGGVFIRIDEVITVGGQLKSIGGTVDIKTPASGRVAEVYVSDGEFVQKDQLLIRFDTRKATEEKKTLTSMIKIEKNELISRLNTLQSQKVALLSQKEVNSQRLKTKIEILDDMRSLVEEGGFQRMQYLESLDEKFALEKKVSELDERMTQLDLQAEQIRLESRKSIDQMKNALNDAELQLQYQNVTAAVSGIIFDPQATPQGVLNSGERILSIVPQAGLYAEIYVPNTDIGYIQKGQQTKVRVDAFPFTRYGELTGSVDQIGADALVPDSIKSFYSFPVKLNLERSFLLSDNIKIPLKSGMSINANLKLRDKRLISILSDLLVDQSDSIRNIRQQ